MSDTPGVDAHGVTDGYYDVDGGWHETSEVARAALHEAIGEPRPGPPIWFSPVGATPDLLSPCDLVLESGADLGVVSRLPDGLPIGYHELRPIDAGPTTLLVVHPERCPEPPPGWGVAVQLYASMSETSQGIGDFADLSRMARWVERLGGNSILLSPLHAGAPGDRQDSPYYPASRRWRNPLHLRVPGVAAERPSRIDRPSVWGAKRPALWALFIADASGAEAPWRVWADQQGESLLQWARWCASTEASDDEQVVDFHRWLQWCVDRQLSAVREAAPAVSLIGDLAIGFDPSGADAEAFERSLAHGCRVGAPPDAFNPAGQDWGLPPFAPWRLRAERYEPFIATLRGALRGLQGLRIDHVMGLFRQYWMAPGLGPTEGAYVRFPAEELLALVALEATRAGAFVVGEDLGTVEPHVRETLARYGILGTVVAWFEDRPPEEYPVEALATVTTHDLPTVAGVWSRADGDDRLVARLDVLTAGDGADGATDVSEVVVAVHRRLAAAPSRLKLVTTDDLCLAVERPNVPGTTVERPNWCLPLPLSLDQLERSDVAGRIASAFSPGVDLPLR